ncbi:MAG: SPOR domain-containing protein [Woeseia sp.]
MDRALKERVVGAAVLMVFIVLVVPVFLDGPAEESLFVTEAVTLPGQNSQQRTRQTIVLERDRDEPVPVRQAAPKPADTEKAEVQTATKPPEPAAAQPAADLPQQVAEAPAKVVSAPAKAVEQPAVKPAAATKSTTGMWAVQLGSFSNKANADRLAAELRGKGYAAFLSQTNDGGKALHRVRVGPQKDRDSAETIAARLAKDGVKGQVVPHP